MTVVVSGAGWSQAGPCPFCSALVCSPASPASLTSPLHPVSNLPDCDTLKVLTLTWSRLVRWCQCSPTSSAKSPRKQSSSCQAAGSHMLLPTRPSTMGHTPRTVATDRLAPSLSSALYPWPCSVVSPARAPRLPGSQSLPWRSSLDTALQHLLMDREGTGDVGCKTSSLLGPTQATRHFCASVSSHVNENGSTCVLWDGCEGDLPYHPPCSALHRLGTIRSWVKTCNDESSVQKLTGCPPSMLYLTACEKHSINCSN